MGEQLILRCENTIDGILTAIYDAFVYKNQMELPYEDNITITIGNGGNLLLFAKEVLVVTDEEKARKTVFAIQSKLGHSIYKTVFYALCHFDEDRASIVLGYLVRAFSKGRRIQEYLADSYVMRVLELSRKVGNECQKLYGFLRFWDAGKFLFSELEPKCDVLPILVEHFSDRYPNEHFIIYDRIRRYALIHPAYGESFFVAGEDYWQGFSDRNPNRYEDEFEELWKLYFKNMGIKERKNERCQDNLLPKWYRKTMPEFQ